MKICMFVLLVVAVTVHAAPKEDSSVIDHVKECLNEYDIKEEEIQELINKDDPKLFCLMACLYEKEGILNNGELSENALVKFVLKDFPQMKEETVHKTFELCIETVNDVTDVCDLTNRLTKCLTEQLEKERATKD